MFFMEVDKAMRDQKSEVANDRGDKDTQMQDTPTQGTVSLNSLLGNVMSGSGTMRVRGDHRQQNGAHPSEHKKFT